MLVAWFSLVFFFEGEVTFFFCIKLFFCHHIYPESGLVDFLPFFFFFNILLYI